MNRRVENTLIRVGIVGTGYAAQRRAEVFQADPRCQLQAVAGHRPETLAEFAQLFCCTAVDTWQALVQQPDLDLVVIATINQLHGAIAEAALKAGKHVVLEYPLALTAEQGQRLVQLAEQQQRLLHVEHIELLGGVHQAILANIGRIGPIFAGRYDTIMPKSPAPRRWTYHTEQFGFPFIAALSRISRFTDLLGPVAIVSAQSRFWPSDHPDYFRACLCQASLKFHTGALMTLSYGKGEVFSAGERTLMLQGEAGTLCFQGESGKLIQNGTEMAIAVGSRRGLFKQDTEAVLEYLTAGMPLYNEVQASLMALQVAEACYLASQNQTVVSL